jgi:molybdopterin-guanine dinucleotide biosynthesis protein A
MIDKKLNVVGGIVLCGGESRRMGTSKAWLEFAGETLLQRIVRLLGEVVRPIVVVGAAGQELPTLPSDVLVVRDEVAGMGPLQGLAGGLMALEGWADAAFVSSCDTPFISPQFVARMIDIVDRTLRVRNSSLALRAQRNSAHGVCGLRSEICVPQANGHFHPLAAVYRLAVLAAVKKLLAEDRRSLQFLFEEVPTRVVTPAELADVDPELQSLRNVNTPEEYQAALRGPKNRMGAL